MRYNRAYISAFGYELAPVVVTSEEIEEHLEPAYRALRLQPGHLKALTGIEERRWWEPEFPFVDAAVTAASRALRNAGAQAADLGALIYAGVNREHYEPATACHVAARLGVSGAAAVYDICNACLGVLNGVIEIANRIELGQIRSGLVVAAETAREINHTMIRRLNENPAMDLFALSLATFTGGSGAAAVLVTSDPADGRRRIVGETARTAPEHHALCLWGHERANGHPAPQFMRTDAPAVLKHGVALGIETWRAFLAELGWDSQTVDRVVCHQVGAANRDLILSTIGIPETRDFSTFPYLGNMGTVSLPLSAALAQERGFLEPGHKVGLLGIGSGLNCQMLGVEW